MRQVITWVEKHEGEYGHPVFKWDFPDEPKRVWTLLTAIEPSAKIVPKHGKNAFLEDKMHDWYVEKGQFHYASRISSGGNWILLEFAD